MNHVITEMLNQYHAAGLTDKKNAVKEIMQEIVLCGLSRAGFFQKAAFYGGTALRIFYGLDRFSEDLEFSLATPDPAFELASYFPTLKKEVASYGLNTEISEKAKTKESAIKSAFLKGSAKEHMLLSGPPLRQRQGFRETRRSRSGLKQIPIPRQEPPSITNTVCFPLHMTLRSMICLLCLPERRMR